MNQPWADQSAEAYSTPPRHPSAPPAAAVQPYSPFPASQVRLVPAGARFGAFLLDVLLALVTLGIGYFIWSLVTWADGQTPAKKMLGHVVADPVTGVPFDWGRMALRQFVIEGLLGGLLSTISVGIYFWVDSLMIFGEGQRTLHDRMANSVVRYA
jgi:hypothetical protein